MLREAARAVRWGAAARALWRAPSAACGVASRLSLACRPLSSRATGFEGMLGMPARSQQPDAEPHAYSRLGRQNQSTKSQSGVLAIKNSWNNTIVTITDTDYRTLGWVSGGTAGFRKGKRSSFFAMEKTLREGFKKAHSLGIRKVMLRMSGPAIVLRKPLFRQIREQTAMRVMKLRTIDSVPHGGCRPRKSKRRRYRTKKRRF